MRQYHITFFYLASGMEGNAITDDYGIVTASSPEEAKRVAAKCRHPRMNEQDIQFTIGCLSAKPIR